jgi:hypothetical protein
VRLTGILFALQHHLFIKKHQIMGAILYIIAVILIIGWAIGTFAYAAGSLIHILLVIAVIALVMGFLRKDTTAV